MPRKKKEELEVTEKEVAEKTAEQTVPEEAPKPKRTRKKKVEEPVEETKVETPPPPPRPDKILTIDVNAEVQTQEALDDIAWHEIHNAYRTRKILTGVLGGIERTENGKTYAIVDYKGFRIIIPLREMYLDIPEESHAEKYRLQIQKYNKLIGSMLNAEIDFIVKGIDSKTRSVVASRTDAMLKKRQIFYKETDENGMPRIYEGRIVQARVVAVAEKAIRIEVFGVECSLSVRDLLWEWVGDANERFAIGDQILVRINSVNCEDIANITIHVDARSVSDNRSCDISQCKIQGKYAGKVIDVHKGVVYIRLSNGVNAVAHSCLDRKLPGKKDDVSFAVTHLDPERNVALGLITRIIKQNL